MELRIEPGLAAKVEQWSAQTGRPVGDLLEDAIAGYFDELGELRSMLDRRYEEIVGGKFSQWTAVKLTACLRSAPRNVANRSRDRVRSTP